MKRILITGKDSYIGTSFEKWVSKWPDEYSVDTVDVRDNSWQKHDFSKYDVVLHVAAIVHVNEKNKDLYYRVNRDLAYNIALKAKESNVKQFIFLSTMGIYGVSKGEIKEGTKPNPKTIYAKSKFEAEKLLEQLKSPDFIVSVLRPPLVYGKNCSGNYSRLSNLAKKIKIFPLNNNVRSMIYIDNLSEFIKQILNTSVSGLYFPQNEEYVNVSNLIRTISDMNNNEICFSRILAIIPKVLPLSIVNKVFGSFIYSKKMSECDFDYNVVDMDESIMLTEN